MSDTSTKRIVVTGHRGAMAHAPENSIRSFQLAAEVGADEVELDIQLSKDGVMVINHDNVVDRTTDGSGLIAAQRWSELSELRIHGIEPLCTFEDVVEEVPDIGLQIEVKDAHAVEPLLDLLRADPTLRDRSMVTCFNPGIVDHVRASGIPVRYARILQSKGGGKLADFIRTGIRHALLKWPLVHTPAMRRFRSEGGKVSVWPCDDEESIRRAIDEGFYGLTTNDPGLAVATRASHTAPI
ncbi:glycerophosphodiester phosphodiesterase [Spelaeicoccus albus]|uniref:Glycerophosphoryl diester phosphodiesterase n=1 Tax=Spelaeicoccus albus TaxID=1280376 RepID=A0A7Z0A8N9_9MICO|nr:glycerophosphodiester phosphodiesterase family protein [Spelaeicoccus albus]NYI66439.1 glycerophosphoryl diester phosphodiesterase [Spelaeicoccus albus]